MPQLPVMNPAYSQGTMMGAQNPVVQQPMESSYMNPSAYGQMPAGMGQMPMGMNQMPAGMGQMPMGMEQMPAGMGQMPMGMNQMPAGMGQMPMGMEQMPAGMGQMPMGMNQMPAGMGQMPMGMNQMPAGMGQMPMGMEQMPMGMGQMPTGYSMPSGYPMGGQTMPAQSTSVMPGTMYGNPGMANPYGYGGQVPYGYPQMGGQFPQVMGVTDFESPEMMAPTGSQMPMMQNPYPTQGLPTVSGGDCGCGGPVPTPYSGAMPGAEMMPAAAPSTFVPPTPPIYSAPYTGPMNAAQPPYMNPYGMAPGGANPYGMPGYRDESN
jgi:morphogenetic protein associated with SpoVID